MAKKKPETRKEGVFFEAFLKYTAKLREEQFNETVDRSRRIVIAARKRRKLFEGLAKKAGFDISQLDALHTKDWETISKQRAKREKGALRLNKLQRECQRLALNTINKHRGRFEYAKGNPQTSLCRWTAVNPPSVVINPQTFNNGNVTIVSLPVGTRSVGQNNLRTRVQVRANLTNFSGLVPVAAVDIFTRHTFEAQVPHDGVVSVVAEYLPMGNIFLGAPGDCILPGGSSAEVVLFMFVEIETPTGEVIELPLGATNTIIDEEIDATCDGANRMIRMGSRNALAYQLAHNDLISVDQGDIVRVNAGIQIYLAAALGGTADAIFTPAPFGLNVPMVMVKVVS